MSQTNKKTILPFASLRILLGLFFMMHAYVVATGLIPLPDQTPRIDFWGVFCVTLSCVTAFYCLTSSYRLFLVGTWIYMPIALNQLNTKITFLEMMIEPNTLQKVTSYGLFGVFLVLISPVALNMFNTSYRDYDPIKNLFFKKGIHF